jgi:Nif-specific regulatory protein
LLIGSARKKYRSSKLIVGDAMSTLLETHFTQQQNTGFPMTLPPSKNAAPQSHCRCISDGPSHRPVLKKRYDFTYCDSGECRIGVLPFLHEISTAMTENNDLSQTLAELLKLMEQRMNIVRGMVTLRDGSSGQFTIHRSFGLSEEQEARGVYSVGEGITGLTAESGEAIVVPRLRDEPRFLNRTLSHTPGDNGDNSFLCVPIKLGTRVLGTIGAERPYENHLLLRQDAELLATISAIIAPAVELYLVKRENSQLRDALKERFHPTNIIGNSKPMLDVYDLIQRLAGTLTTVLILGESGVGKELIASAIHYNGPWANGPFVKFNCAALPEQILESELFGHEKGAFTGATAQRKGRFELAAGGTIFLDEVGELSLLVQAKLLRILQERTFERVGGNQTLKVDLRIIAATNRDLREMVTKGSFREDLFYRLSVFPITVPPLRARGSDVILLADHFVKVFSKKLIKRVQRISTPALDMLMSYHWPGNVRELENAIERAIILSDDEVIHQYDLPPSLQTASESGTAYESGLKLKLQSVEHEMIVEALKTHRGNVSEAASELNLTRRVLSLRMKAYGIDYKAYRLQNHRASE